MALAGKLTHREARYVVARNSGKSRYQALIDLGFPHGFAKNPSLIETPQVLEAIERYRQELVENTLEVGLIDAIEIHEYLTDCIRADMRDIRNDDGSFKPQSEWPPIWGRMMEAGDCEVEYSSQRSNDGKTKNKKGGWDEKGEVKKVKLRFTNRSKLLELAMKHVGVRAMQESSPASLTINNITIEQRISQARQRLLQAKSNDVSFIESKDDNMRAVNEIESKDDPPT